MAGWLAASAATADAAARDRDRDRLPDRWEKRYRLSTTKHSARQDPDRDGLSNRREYRLKINPRRRDTDRDGLHDGLEVGRYKTNPRKRDTDGDGVYDGAEVRAGTDPRDRAEQPATAAPPGAPPSPASVGVPAGWAPAQTRASDLVVDQPGAIVQDILFTGGDLIINAPDVTVRRIRMQGGRINNWQGPRCQNGLLVEDSTFEPAPGRQYASDSEGMTGVGGYTARRVKIANRGEGFRAGGKSGGCGPVRIEDSFAKIAIAPGCPGDPHADGIQGYDAPPLSISNVTIDFSDAECGTAPLFVPDKQGNTSVDIDGLLVMGGGYSFRLGVPGRVHNLKIVDDSWVYAPVDVKCSLISAWHAQLVTIDADYRITRSRGAQPCAGE